MENATRVRLLIVIVFCASLFSCSNDNKIQNAISPAAEALETYKNLDSEKEIIEQLLAGDSLAYRKVRSIYFESGHKKEFLYYAILMSNDYHLPEASSDIYFILSSDSVGVKNRITNKLANYFLIKAFESKLESEKTVRERIKNKSTAIPKADEYWCQIYR